MNIWSASREYAGIAEAGGVKNVSCSLSESLVRLGHKVTFFIPIYKCSNLKVLDEFHCVWHKPVKVFIRGRSVLVTFSHGIKNGVEFVFVSHSVFNDKEAVYTYTKAEEMRDPEKKQGEGHKDALFMDTLFQKSCVAFANSCDMEERPDIFLCQDASCATIPAFIKEKSDLDETHSNFYDSTKCVVTIHNAGPGYHHDFPNVDCALDYTALPYDFVTKAVNPFTGGVEPFVLGAYNAYLTTVSPEYASEIMENRTDTAGISDMLRDRNFCVYGITNGLDFESYNPENMKVSLLPYEFSTLHGMLQGKMLCRKELIKNYASLEENRKVLEMTHIEQYGYIQPSENDKAACFVFHGRLVNQKGIDVLAGAADMLLASGADVRFIFIGQGQSDLERLLLNVALKYEGKCVYFRGYDKALSRLCIASADFSLLPSKFEPCCLEDFISQIYGTIPIANATGGLCKIVSSETGYLYSPNMPEVLFDILKSITTIYAFAGREGFDSMRTYAARYVYDKYSWDKVALGKYIPMFETLLEKK